MKLSLELIKRITEICSGGVTQWHDLDVLILCHEFLLKTSMKKENTQKGYYEKKNETTTNIVHLPCLANGFAFIGIDLSEMKLLFELSNRSLKG